MKPSDNLVERLMQADFVCRDCGDKYGKYSVECSSTWEGQCHVCGETKSITEVRDWGYLAKGIALARAQANIKEQSKVVADYMLGVGPIMNDDELEGALTRIAMTGQNPITPPPELVQQWIDEEDGLTAGHIATQAARWGANQQLAEDAKWLDQHALDAPHLKITPVGKSLIEAMRPKAPTLKELALARLTSLEKLSESMGYSPDDTIRRALEALDD